MKYQQHEQGYRKKKISLERGITLREPEREKDHCEIPTIGGVIRRRGSILKKEQHEEAIKGIRSF